MTIEPLVLHCAITWALAGLIWTVQLVSYPLFGKVGREAFPSYHAAHMARITLVVAPLMFGELATAVWLVVQSTDRGVLFIASLPLLGLNWVSTALVQVPLHKKLERDGFDESTWRKLTTSNWIRTIAWSLRALLLGILLIGSA
ncbi:MAG: hypothetical protein ACR2RV_06835 [Verrucomicrobiales bacterium]